jgi:dsRNA-specific ribonuclease
LLFRLEREDGPAHERRFVCSVQVETKNGTFVTIGDPMSRVKDAENSAAQKMMEVLLQL